MLAAATAALLGALAFQVEPGAPRPGDIVSVTVTGTAKPPEGTLGTRELTFLPMGDRWVALEGLSIEARAATLPLTVIGVDESGKRRLDGQVDVRPWNWPHRTLSLARKFTHPSKKEQAWSAADQKAFDAAFDVDYQPWTFARPFAMPRPPYLTAPYGDHRVINGVTQSIHYGIDLDGSTGDPIYATQAGDVVMVRECFGSGGTVLLHHGGRLFSAYFHMSAFDVKVGEKVVQGQLLGKVGKSGRVTGPHLHFGVKLDGKWQDPESLLRLSFAPPLRSTPLSNQSNVEAASPGTP